jgi:hypothetical protein
MEIIIKGYTVKIDSQDFSLVSSGRWYLVIKKGYEKWVYFYRNEKGTRKRYGLHRLIARARDDQEVDHIDGDTLNNTRENLRLCTRSQNMMNGPQRKKTSSGFRGVTWRKKEKNWVARIGFEGKLYYLGSFKNAKEAHDEYLRKAKELFGSFLRIE